MIELVTISRPYATAAFDFAVEHNSIEHWQSMLEFASEVFCQGKMAEYFTGFLVPKDLSTFFNLVCAGNLDEYGRNFIKIIVENKRLIALPNILKEFIKLRNKYESISEVEVISPSVLGNDQLYKISMLMEKHLSSKVQLNFKFDKSLISGVIIRTNDFVINASLRSRFDYLANILQS